MKRILILLIFLSFLACQLPIERIEKETTTKKTTETRETMTITKSIEYLDHISIYTEHEVTQRREDLLYFFFGKTTTPMDYPTDIVYNYTGDTRYNDITNLDKIDKITFHNEYGIDSIIYHFFALNNRKQKVLFYHQGHMGDFYFHKDFIAKALNAGIDVIAFCMPLYGLNNTPTVNGVLIDTHEELANLIPAKGHPLKYFLLPVIAMINHCERQSYGYTTFAMAGLSGGAWTTTVIVAIEPRIHISFPASGGYPIWLYGSSYIIDNLCWEMRCSDLWSWCSYEDMFVLSAYNNRAQYRCISPGDPVSLEGHNQAWLAWYDDVQSITDGFGIWDVFIDETNDAHKIGDESQNFIIQKILEQ